MEFAPKRAGSKKSLVRQFVPKASEEAAKDTFIWQLKPDKQLISKE